jgi:hypothetical protein
MARWQYVLVRRPDQVRVYIVVVEAESEVVALMLARGPSPLPFWAGYVDPEYHEEKITRLDRSPDDS